MIIRLSDTDPFYNLAIEDWLFRYVLSEQPILLFYTNQPCVVIGRGQNPWRECNLALLQKKGIPLVRRQSGGGTVFHDLGNVNFSFLMPKCHYDKKQHLKIIQQALSSLSTSVKINDRHDLITLYKNQWCKVSGSAFRERKDYAFHHGTLLINSDLNTLNNGLKPVNYTVTGKGASSVRSPVCNLVDVCPSLTQAQVIQTIAHVFTQTYGGNTITDTFFPTGEVQQYLSKKQQEYKSWAWRFGKTLPCTITHPQGYHAYIERGYLIKEASTWPSDVEPLPYVNFR